MRKHFIFLATIAVMAFTTVSCSLDPTIDYVRLCNNPDYDRTCPDDQNVFNATETDTLYLTAVLNHVPEGTNLSIKWFFIEKEEQEISSVELKTEEEAIDYPINTRLWPPSDGWPLGDYKVVVDLSSEGFEAIEKKFSVE